MSFQSPLTLLPVGRPNADRLEHRTLFYKTATIQDNKNKHNKNITQKEYNTTKIQHKKKPTHQEYNSTRIEHKKNSTHKDCNTRKNITQKKI